MQGEIFYSLSIFSILLGFGGAMALASEIGWRFARKVPPEHADDVRRQVDVVQTAVLALLGLLLSFTFAMATGRFDSRKQYVAQEANAIGTAYLRAGLLAEPTRSESRKIFREYLDLRLRANAADAPDPQRAEADRLAAAEQGKLWALAAKHLETHPENHVGSHLYIVSLNEAFDVHDFRNAALDNHVPESVLGLLFLVGSLSMGIVAYSYGLSNRRGVGQLVLFGALIFSVVVTIMDLDRPRRGLIRVGQASMQNLRDHLDD